MKRVPNLIRNIFSALGFAGNGKIVTHTFWDPLRFEAFGYLGRVYHYEAVPSPNNPKLYEIVMISAERDMLFGKPTNAATVIMHDEATGRALFSLEEVKAFFAQLEKVSKQTPSPTIQGLKAFQS